MWVTSRRFPQLPFNRDTMSPLELARTVPSTSITQLPYPKHSQPDGRVYRGDMPPLHPHRGKRGPGCKCNRFTQADQIRRLKSNNKRSGLSAMGGYGGLPDSNPGQDPIRNSRLRSPISISTPTQSFANSYGQAIWHPPLFLSGHLFSAATTVKL